VLLWELEYGGHLDALERAAARGMPVKALDNRPKTDPRNVLYLAVFRDCSRRRAENTSAIPISEIVAWLDLHQIDSIDEREEIFDVVNAMDEAFMTHFAAKLKRQQGH